MPRRVERILIGSVHYAPDLIGCAKYTAEMAEELVARGHQVEVVAPPPFYPEWRRAVTYGAMEWRTETINGVRVHRVPTFIPASPSGMARLLHLASFALSGGLKIIARAFSFRPTLVLTIAPTMALTPASLIAAELCGARSWIHVQDFEVDAAFELGLLNGRAKRQFATTLERWLLASHDIASSISPAMVGRLLQKGVRTERTAEFRNWADTAAIRTTTAEASPYRTRLGIPAGAVVALYSGNMAAKQGIEVLADVAADLHRDRPDIYVVLCGDGPLKPKLQQLCGDLRTVRFLPLQPKTSLSDLLGMADIHLLPQRKEAADLVLPSKLTGMLASGRPIVCGAEAQTGLAREVEGSGLLVEPGDALAMAGAIRELADSPQQRAALGQHARRVAETRWSQEAIFDALERRLSEFAPNKAHAPAPVDVNV